MREKSIEQDYHKILKGNEENEYRVEKKKRKKL